MESRRLEPKGSPVPIAAWLLLAAAAATLALFVVRNWYELFGPYLIVRPERVVDALGAIGPLLVAAGVVIGGARWSAGQRWLPWGAAAFAVHGLLDAAFSGWVAWWETSPGLLDPSADGLLLARAWTSLAAAVAGPALVAVGIWATGRRTGRMGVARTAVAGAIALAGVIGIAGGVALAAVELARTSTVGYSGIGIVSGPAYSIGVVLAAAAMAVLAIAVLRATPRHGPLPEIVIVAGATLAAVGPGWMAWAQVVLPQATLAEQAWLAFLLPRGVTAAGMLLVAVGFALGAVAPRRSEPT